MVKVILPHPLRSLARISGEVEFALAPPVTVATILDAIEARYPMLQGTLRDHDTRERRPYVRFYACSEDVSHQSPDQSLPSAIARGDEPFLILGAISGGGNL